MLAAREGDLPIVEALIAAGADVNAWCPKYSWEEMLRAVKRGIAEGASAPLEAGADAQHRTADGWTALLLAAEGKHQEAVSALIAAGADVDVARRDGTTALLLAAQAGDLVSARALVMAGAQVDTRTWEGHSPLLAARLDGHLELARLLEERGAQLGIDDRLFVAAHEGNLAKVCQALSDGANVNAVRRGLRTPLMHAAAGGFSEIVTELLAAGADPNYVSHWVGVLKEATRAGHEETARILRAAGAVEDPCAALFEYAAGCRME